MKERAYTKWKTLFPAFISGINIAFEFGGGGGAARAANLPAQQVMKFPFFTFGVGKRVNVTNVAESMYNL